MTLKESLMIDKFEKLVLEAKRTGLSLIGIKVVDAEAMTKVIDGLNKTIDEAEEIIHSEICGRKCHGLHLRIKEMRLK